MSFFFFRNKFSKSLVRVGLNLYVHFVSRQFSVWHRVYMYVLPVVQIYYIFWLKGLTFPKLVRLIKIDRTLLSSEKVVTCLWFPTGYYFFTVTPPDRNIFDQKYLARLYMDDKRFRHRVRILGGTDGNKSRKWSLVSERKQSRIIFWVSWSCTSSRSRCCIYLFGCFVVVSRFSFA